jgi:hypothetical protein
MARLFSATAHPQGDPAFAVHRPLVQVAEYGPDGYGAREVKRVIWLHPDEAMALAAQLRAALASLGGVKPAPSLVEEFA